MSLLDIVRNAVVTADSVTKPLQGSVQHIAWTSRDAFGKDTYAAPVTVKAVVDLTRKQRMTKEGELKMTIASVTILQAVTPNGASGRSEPIDFRDRIILPDGSTGPIVSVGGFMDAVTGRPVLNEVLLGVEA